MYCKPGSSVPHQNVGSSPSQPTSDILTSRVENDGPTINCSPAPFLDTSKTLERKKGARAHRRRQGHDNLSTKSTSQKADVEDESLITVSGSFTSARAEANVAKETGTVLNAPNSNSVKGTLYHLIDDIEGDTPETQFGLRQEGIQTLISPELSGSAECLLIHHESFGVELSPRRCAISRLSDPGTRNSDKRSGKDCAQLRRPQWGQGRRCARWSTQIGQKPVDIDAPVEPFLLEGSQLLQGNYLRPEVSNYGVHESNSKQAPATTRETHLGFNEWHSHTLNTKQSNHGAEYHMKVVTRGCVTNRVNRLGFPAPNFIRLEPSPRAPVSNNVNMDSVDEILLQHRKSDSGTPPVNCKSSRAGQVLLPMQQEFGSRLHSSGNIRNEHISQASKGEEGNCLTMVGVKVGGLAAKS